MYKILPYYSFGNNRSIEFRGRVVVDNNFETYAQKDGWLNNAIAFFKRYNIKPVPNLELKVSFENKDKKIATNDYGIFSVTFDPSDQLTDKWQVAQAKIKLADKEIIANLVSVIDVSGNEYGIISDIDDTILISNAPMKLKLIWNTVFKNSRSRLAFEGVANFYNMLVAGNAGSDTNPIFYVSSSHWNLYDALQEFLKLAGFPKGILMLKRVNGWRELLKTVGDHHHKSDKIIEIFERFPDLSFVLIGDSGQRDAAIYAKLAIDYPNRVKAILIRDVTPYEDEVVLAAQKIIPAHIPFKTFKETDEAEIIAKSLDLL